MKLFKTKNEKLVEMFEKKINSMNFDSPNEQIESIDSKLEILFKNMEYNDYINFIKSNKYLKTYDDILGNYANNVPLSKNIIDLMSSDFYNNVETIVKNKIDELNL